MENRSASYTETLWTYHDKKCTKQADSVNLTWESVSVARVMQQFMQQGWKESGGKKNYLVISGMCSPQISAVTKPCDTRCNLESNEQRYHVRLWNLGSDVVGSAHIDKRLWPAIYPIRRHKAVSYAIAVKGVAADFLGDGYWTVTEDALLMNNEANNDKILITLNQKT